MAREAANSQKNGSKDASFFVSEMDGAYILSASRNIGLGDVTALNEELKKAARQEKAIIVDFLSCFNIAPECLLALARWARLLERIGRTVVICSHSLSMRQHLRTMLIKRSQLSNIKVRDSLSRGLKVLTDLGKRPLGDILFTDFGIDREEIVRALKAQKLRGGLLGEILMAQKAVSEFALKEALTRQAA